jgi:hypothetical protein
MPNAGQKGKKKRTMPAARGAPGIRWRIGIARRAERLHSRSMGILPMSITGVPPVQAGPNPALAKAPNGLPESVQCVRAKGVS